MSVDGNIRDQRLQDGCCPNCATRLYKISNSSSGGVMSKMFKKKAASSSPNPIKMTPLTVPGVVERGQCVKCANGKSNQVGAAAAGGDGNDAVFVPTVKAVPVVVSGAAAPTVPPPNENQGEGGNSPQSKPEVQFNEQIIRNGGSNHGGDLKQPPEKMIGVNENGNSQSSSSGSGSEESESEDSSYEDDESLEDVPLLDLDVCQLESDHASSSLANSLRRHDDSSVDVELFMEGENDDADDNRKPAAKPSVSNADIRKLQLEAAAIDMACLESTDTQKMTCPSGMSPEVFYELPPEMQKEVIEQGSRSNSDASQTKIDAGNNRGSDATITSAADIDPETLASLPDHIRKEVLEQARREQQQSNTNAPDKKVAAVIAPRRTRKPTRDSALSMSTTAFLSDCDIDAEDYEQFDDEVKKDIMDEKVRRSSSSVNEKIVEETTQEGQDEDLDFSGYDPETLASLPEDVRKEVLEEERRQREKKRQSVNKLSSVGAHSVNVPAGYDPDTFSALPEEMQKELLEDASRQAGRRYSADGYDFDSIVDATVVQAGPMVSGGGNVTSCTYEGEYNMRGKRHGDGELKWANGDKYVGRFKDGFIEGRGTISFHDGTEYAGQWTKNRFHGEGTRRFNNGNVYTGNYVSGKRQGQGKCYFANGDMYVGDWKEDTIHGFGRYYYNNGHSFEGMFRNGKRNGRGKYQLTDGRVEIYRYVNDSRVGDGVRWSANRKKAWRMNDGKVTKRVSIEDAAAIAKRCGPVVEES
eukprot:CAMPEP_0172303248 /NCGR_PEP_ID=MMETSP1058-20130122/4810_1 /TAXON_ID=83371 /ORGANISM="Detonula confervacea, Strain CCMP 353" /LENGTH=753 /DNA_ID=CAMNT_0013013989 /DNA_START=281 /DNA_END=2542 /DNA_ORIENTATION=-